MWPVVYLLHFNRPIGNPANTRALAQHYTGWTPDLLHRIAEHKAGRGAAITRAAVDQGIDWEVFVLGYGDWRLEQQVKAIKNNRRLCPICGVRHPRGQAHLPVVPVEQLALDLDGDPFDVPVPAMPRFDRWEWLVRKSWSGVVDFGCFRRDTSMCDIPF